MSRSDGGWWRLVIYLPAGTYRFRYCADGQWFIDHAAFGVRHGPYGPDSILEVPGDAVRSVPSAEPLPPAGAISRLRN